MKVLMLLALLQLAWGEPAPMVHIPAGLYRAPYNLAPASGANRKPSPVRVAGFWLDRYPVTNQKFLQFVRTHPEWRRSRVKRLFADRGYLSYWKGDLSYPPELAHSPVVQVSWFAARAYCQSRGQRLPTQQEWEFAAQPGSDRLRQQILEWYGRPTPARLPSVEQSAPNPFGVCAMHGLAWEWVEDFNTILVTGESRGDSGLERDLYCAGGAVNSIDPSDYATAMRFAFRASLQARYTVANLGFRGAR
ncbi:formylglycine-generating enzyme family protein [bacterium]|nr:formylglycine-generating enzyme family protein [bacterium]